MTNSTAPTHGETGAPSLSRGRTSASGGAFAALADTVAIVVFATIGRASHEHGMSVAGVAQTAAPFLVGAALGWVACLAMRRRAPLSVGDGLVVWAGTLVGGVLLRRVTGQGTAPSFIVVAGLVTGAFLLGWRAVRAAAARRR